jgi:hypothetical protein
MPIEQPQVKVEVKAEKAFGDKAKIDFRSRTYQLENYFDFRFSNFKVVKICTLPVSVIGYFKDNA